MKGVFSWGKDSAPPAGVDEHATTPGAQDTAPGASGVSAHTVAAARENAEAALARSPRKRGRPAADAGNVQRDSGALQAQINAEIRAQLDALHDPKLWGALLAAPGDTALAITGREYWEISKDERELLGAGGSAAARTLMITNPRALALFMLTGTLITVYLPRMSKELAHIRDEREKKESEKKDGAKTITH